jgi:EAL domain-containing protein (putative c-di-GMP-specific phosphodiesterase class I)
METDMRRALEREEFLIHYQPIVALDNFRLRGFEALVRWQHPERGFISPMDFIPIAEETGLIIPLGELVMREACAQMQRWQAMFPVDPPLYVAVNLSSKQFSQSTLISKVATILQETGVNPSSVKLEITESLVMENIDTATDMLRQLRALGIKLAIDDFGTGYSSLSYLHRFPIDTLKIDRSFVTRMSENNENTEIVRTIVVLAQNLGMDVVAEGVETNEQLVLLQKLGCENGQGYFFSKPVAAEGAERIIAETYGALTSPLRRMNPQSNGKRVLVA